MFGLQKPCGVLVFIKYLKAFLFILFCFAMRCNFFWKASRMMKQLVAESPAQCAENEDWLG